MSGKQRALLYAALGLLPVLLMICPGEAQAFRSCLPDFTALTVVKSVGEEGEGEFTQILSSENESGRFQTDVEWVGNLTADPQSGYQLNMKFRFSAFAPDLSLPANIYAVLVVFNGAPLAWWDFTEECMDPGISFFPGQEFDLPQIKNLPVEGSPRQLQVIVWARL